MSSPVLVSVGRSVWLKRIMLETLLRPVIHADENEMLVNRAINKIVSSSGRAVWGSSGGGGGRRH